MKKVQIPDGCRTSLNGGHAITSTGNPPLDEIIGGGCPLGSILLIEEDRYGNYARVISKYFLAEGIYRRHGIYLMSLDESPMEFLRTVPKSCVDKEVNVVASKQNDDMRIAFRYNQLPVVEAEVSGPKTYYDLSSPITESELTNYTDLHCCDNLDTFMANIRSVVKVGKYQNSPETGGSNLLRICLSSFGSPLWYNDEDYAKHLIMQLVQLKALVRNTSAVCLITVPGHLLRAANVHLLDKIRNLVDISLEIESFIASEKETNPVFKDYHGLIHIRKIAALNTLAAFCPNTLDLGFKLRRKKFTIEKLHLPPLLDEEDTIKPRVAAGPCASLGGGAGRSNLDF